MKTLVTVGITLGAVIVVVVLVSLLRGGKSADENAAEVRVEPVARGELIEVVQAPGEIQPRTKVSISAKVAARIIDIPLLEGQRVSQGDVLLKMDASDLQAVLRSSQARYAAQEAAIRVAEARIAAQKSQLEGTRATLAEAQRDLERQEGLLTSHDVSQSIVDTAQRRVEEQHAAVDAAAHTLVAEQTNLQVMRHNLDAADADVARAREDLSYTTIASPLNGVVTTINAKVGELVVTGTMNNAGTVIMEVADLSQMLVQARVDETDVANVEVGHPARVHVQAYGDRVFTGKVTSVALARTVDRSMRVDDAKTFKVEILLDTGGERLYSGLTADVEIETRKHGDVLKVPSQAVLGRSSDELPQAIRDSDPNVDKTKTQTTVVYRFIDGKAMVTPVTVGPSDITHTLIRSGLSADDRVITGPYKVLENLSHERKVKEQAKAATQPSTQKSD